MLAGCTADSATATGIKAVIFSVYAADGAFIDVRALLINRGIISLVCEAEIVSFHISLLVGVCTVCCVPVIIVIIRPLSIKGMNVTQCRAGSVNMDIYATGKNLKEAGVVNGYDSTTESALAKLFFLMGHHKENLPVKINLEKELRGEISK